ncbi:MAG: hypothetical protein LIP01_07670 [Tannerellaceae bacterium]|nr:hypothetical protein [Tannerellaceae bacterium]
MWRENTDTQPPIFSISAFMIFCAQGVGGISTLPMPRIFRFLILHLQKIASREEIAKSQSTEFHEPEEPEQPCRFDFIFFNGISKNKIETKQKPPRPSCALAHDETTLFPFVGCSDFPVCKILPYKIWQNFCLSCQKGTCSPFWTSPAAFRFFFLIESSEKRILRCPVGCSPPDASALWSIDHALSLPPSSSQFAAHSGYFIRAFSTFPMDSW